MGRGTQLHLGGSVPPLGAQLRAFAGDVGGVAFPGLRYPVAPVIIVPS